MQRGFLFLTVRFAGDEPVERGLPADDAVNDFLAEAAVGGRKPRGPARFEQVFGEFIGGSRWLQNARSNLSWILVVQLV